MPTIKTELEGQLYNPLKRITRYEEPEKLRRHAERMYGVSGDEAVDMAYENVLFEARSAIKRVRLPKSKAAPATTPSAQTPAVAARGDRGG